jgi:hypothetical protein
MAKQSSKKRGKVIDKTKVIGAKFSFPPFAKLLAPGTSSSVWVSSTPPFNVKARLQGSYKIYPGAVIPVTDEELLGLLEYMKSFDEPRVLPPGVPLDEDIFDGILRHLWWFQHEKAYAVFQITESAIDKLYMEVLWRQIQKK